MSEIQAITRLAPTPSGYLHEGNAVNFLLVRRLADAVGARVLLRIDDMDAERMRPAYVEDVFEVLHWLGIRWDDGPIDAMDFDSRFSLRARHEAYRLQAGTLMTAGHAYACICSRRQGAGRCVRDCRTSQHDLVPGISALRLAIEPGTLVQLDGRWIDLHHEIGDPVIWRRDDHVAYHLASVIEDRDHEVTHVVRGEDLRASSALHAYLGPILGARTPVQYLHHPLVVDADGNKLSKSQLRTGPMPRTTAKRASIEDIAEGLVDAILRDFASFAD
jgi:glutamyl/glutaminyl-tRNA synthetase